ncbi:MAG: peptide deformylase [Pseudomonadota bacterium]
MTVRNIIRMGHPTLREKALAYPPGKIGGSEFRTLVTDMRDTMYAAGGIGLAAPQIDVPFQLAVIEIPASGTRYGDVAELPFAVYVNPTITVLDTAEAGYWEGCLSVPGMMGYVERPQHIRVDYLDEAGDARSLEATGFTATVFQHEFDHLYGTLYVDRIRDMRMFMYEQEFHDFQEDDAPLLD